MALLTKAQFAEKINRPSNFLSVYITRKEVVIHSGSGKNALIDDTNPVNYAFLIKKGAKDMANGVEKEEKPQVYHAVVVEDGDKASKKTKPASNGKDANEVYMKNLAVLEQQKAEIQVKKQREELEKISLFNQKARGELLPFALFKPLLARNNQHLTTTFKNLAEELISDMTKKKSFSSEERGELTKLLLNGINRSINEANDMTVKSLDIIIEDYKESVK